MSPTVKSLSCPNCGGAIEIRALEHTQSVVCVQCLSILDAKDPNLRVLQDFSKRERVQPRIPLGTRGKLHGDVYEVIGFQDRTIYVENDAFTWSEYLLFNPFKGFRYITEYQGHWNDVKTVRSVPEMTHSGSKPAARLLGETYTHFQTATAETTFVMGEFPWQVRVGDRVEASDFIAPPRILSREKSGAETTWSLGEYTTGARIWEIFQLPGSPPPPIGIFANQPSPYKGRIAGMWQTFLALACVALLMAVGLFWLTRREEVFRRSYSLSSMASATPFTTDVFELKGRASNVELEVRTDLSNNWAFFHFALINEATGEARDFGREVSYYFGRDSDGSWSEGRPGDRVLIPTVPAGRYYLLVDPEAAPGVRSLNYELRLTRDVPTWSLFGVAAGLLLLPPLLASLRAFGFEQARWRESDYAPAASDDDEEDEEDGE